MMKVDKLSNRGFTLLEVMVAVAILAIALVVILKANIQSLEVLTDTREAATVSLLAASKLAEVEAIGLERWNQIQGDFGDEYPDFTWEVDIAPTEVEGLSWVAVTVRAREGGTGSEARIEELLLVQ